MKKVTRVRRKVKYISFKIDSVTKIISNFDFFSQCGGQEAAASRLAKAYKELETGPISTHLSGHTEPLDFMHRYV